MRGLLAGPPLPGRHGVAPLTWPPLRPAWAAAGLPCHACRHPLPSTFPRVSAHHRPAWEQPQASERSGVERLQPPATRANVRVEGEQADVSMSARAARGRCRRPGNVHGMLAAAWPQLGLPDRCKATHTAQGTRQRRHASRSGCRRRRPAPRRRPWRCSQPERRRSVGRLQRGARTAAGGGASMASAAASQMPLPSHSTPRCTLPRPPPPRGSPPWLSPCSQHPLACSRAPAACSARTPPFPQQHTRRSRGSSHELPAV